MPQTLEQFGQTIKQKHPEYKDLGDAELGQKVLDKYPQYKDMVQVSPKPQKTGFLQNLAQGAAKFIGGEKLATGAAQLLGGGSQELTNATTQTSSNVDKLLTQARTLPITDPRRKQLLDQAKQMSTELGGQATKFIGELPTTGEVAGSAGQLGLTLGTLGTMSGAGKLGAIAEKIPVGGLGTNIVKGVGLGAGFGATGSLEGGDTEAKDIIKNTLIGGAIGGAIPLAGAGLAKLKQATTKVLPEKLINTYLPSNIDLSQHVLKNTELGTTRTMLKDSATNVKNLSKQIDGILESKILPATTNIEATKVGQAINRNSLLKRVAQSYGQTGGGGTIKSKEIINNVTRVAPQVKGLLLKDNLTLKEANNLRKAIDQSLGDRFFLAKHSPFTKEVAGEFNSILRDTVKELAPETKPIFEELQKEINVRNALNKYVKKSGNITLTDLLTAITGLATTAPLGFLRGAGTAVGLVAGEKALRSPAVGIGVAKGLSKLGEKVAPEIAKRAGIFGILRGSTSRQKDEKSSQ